MDVVRGAGGLDERQDLLRVRAEGGVPRERPVPEAPRRERSIGPKSGEGGGRAAWGSPIGCFLAEVPLRRPMPVRGCHGQPGKERHRREDSKGYTHCASE